MSTYLPKPRVTVQCDLTLTIVIPAWTPSTPVTYGVQLSIGSTPITIATGVPYNPTGDTVIPYTTPITLDKQYAVTVYTEGGSGYPQSTTLGATGATPGWVYEGFTYSSKVIDCPTVGGGNTTTTTSKPGNGKGGKK